ncbi:MAG: ribosome assembly factor SBDS [Candidatus Bathyarchaeia archaeon]
MSEKFTTARISIGGERFEILVKPDPALRFKQGERLGISQVLGIEEVYSDANKGTRISAEKMKKSFGTLDILSVAERILREGELQLTTDQRRRLTEEKKRQIVAFISRNSIDPRSGAPHPPLRIEQALEQVRVSIDPFKSVEEQSKTVLEQLKKILPIKIENMKVAVRIAPEFAAKAYNIVKNLGTVTKEEWLKDGSWSGVVEMPAGLYGPFVDKIGKATRGTVQAQPLK